MLIDGITSHTPVSLLKGIVDNQLSVSTVISDRAIKSSEEAQKIIKALTSAAIQLNYPEIVRELGEAETIGVSLPDPYLDVPEVCPVTITMVGLFVLTSFHPFISLIPYQPILNKDGSPSGETKTEIPFNLAPRACLSSTDESSRRTLPRDKSSLKTPYMMSLLNACDGRPSFSKSSG